MQGVEGYLQMTSLHELTTPLSRQFGCLID